MTKTKITKRDVEEYVASDGVHCIVCGSKRIEGQGPYVSKFGDDVLELVRCRNCNAEWADELRVASIKFLIDANGESVVIPEE